MKFLQQKMYIHAKTIFRRARSSKMKFSTLFFGNIAGANRLKTNGISSYVSLLITRRSEFDKCERNLAAMKHSSVT